MKIPEYQPMQVAPEGVRLPTREAPRQDFSGLSQAANELGAGVSQVHEAYASYQHQARITQVNDASTEYEKAYTDAFHGSTAGTAVDPKAPVPDVTKMSEQEFGSFLEGPPAQQTPGFLATRGQAALQNVDDTLKDLEKDRLKIATSLTDPEAKKMFLEASARRRALIEREAQDHVAQQLEVAKVDSVKAGLAQTLRSVSLDPKNEQLATLLVAEQAGRSTALATSPEVADAQATAIRAEVAKTRAQALLLAKDFDGAEKVVLGSRKALGEDGNALIATIAKERSGVETAATATAVVQQSMRPDGSVNERAVFDSLSKAPAEQQQRLLPAVHERLTEARKAYDADTDRLLSRAMASYNVNGWTGMSVELKDALNNRRDDERGPALYARLKASAEERYRHAKASKSDQDRWQLQVNRDALNDFKSLPTDVQATLDLSPNGEFAQAHPDVDVHGWKGISPHQKTAVDVVTRGQSVQADSFVKDVVANADKWLVPGTTKDEKDARAKRLDDVKARARDAFNDFREAHAGKVPSTTEAAGMVGDIVLGLTPTNDAQAKASAAAIIERATKKPPAAPGIHATGRKATLPDGSVWREMSDGSARMVSPPPVK